MDHLNICGSIYIDLYLIDFNSAESYVLHLKPWKLKYKITLIFPNPTKLVSFYPHHFNAYCFGMNRNNYNKIFQNLIICGLMQTFLANSPCDSLPFALFMKLFIKLNPISTLFSLPYTSTARSLTTQKSSWFQNFLDYYDDGNCDGGSNCIGNDVVIGVACLFQFSTSLSYQMHHYNEYLWDELKVGVK